MKLSNKVLVGFFGFAFIYLTAVFAEVRLRGTPNIINDTNSVAETVDIPGISYVVLRDVDYRIDVIGSSDQPQLEVRSIAGDLLKGLKHKISGDTLTLSEFPSEGRKRVKISVFVPKAGLKGITVNAAEANVKGLEQEHLNISQNAARIWMSGNRIGEVHLEVSGKSHLDISDTALNTLSATIDNSEVSISSPVGRLQGSMQNNSFLRMNEVDEIKFKKDETSRLNVYP